MAGRGSAFQKILLGLEATPGTPVAASKQLQCLYMRPRPREPRDPFLPIGNLYPSESTKQKAWTDLDITGVGAYNDLAYMFDSLLYKQPGAGFDYKPDTFNPQSVRTYTVEHGSTGQAERMAYMFVHTLSISFTRTAVDVRGSAMARRIEENFTMTTAGVTRVPKRPMDPANTDVFIAATSAGLAAGQLDKGIDIAFSWGNTRGGGFFLRKDQPSFSDDYQGAPELRATLAVEHDTDAAAYMANLRNGDIQFVRVSNIGKEYGVGTPYTLEVTAPFQFLENTDRGDRDRVYASMWNLLPVHDDVFAAAIQAKILTDMGAIA